MGNRKKTQSLALDPKLMRAIVKQFVKITHNLVLGPLRFFVSRTVSQCSVGFNPARHLCVSSGDLISLESTVSGPALVLVSISSYDTHFQSTKSASVFQHNSPPHLPDVNLELASFQPLLYCPVPLRIVGKGESISSSVWKTPLPSGSYRNPHTGTE